MGISAVSTHAMRVINSLVPFVTLDVDLFDGPGLYPDPLLEGFPCAIRCIWQMRKVMVKEKVN